MEFCSCIHRHFVALRTVGICIAGSVRRCVTKGWRLGFVSSVIPPGRERTGRKPSVCRLHPRRAVVTVSPSVPPSGRPLPWPSVSAHLRESRHGRSPGPPRTGARECWLCTPTRPRPCFNDDRRGRAAFHKACQTYGRWKQCGQKSKTALQTLSAGDRPKQNSPTGPHHRLAGQPSEWAPGFCPRRRSPDLVSLSTSLLSLSVQLPWGYVGPPLSKAVGGGYSGEKELCLTGSPWGRSSVLCRARGRG